MKKYLLAVFVAVLSITCLSSYSFGIDEVKKLLAHNLCLFCNLSGADLEGAELGEALLFRADLSNVNLYGANLMDANLRGADLAGANLTGADLTGTMLRRADLGGAILCQTKTPWGEDNSDCK